jgi:DNA-binding MarR family transcriptional regulator
MMSTKPKATKKSPRQASDMIEVNHGDAILRTFILFVQTARAVLKYADVHLYRKAHFSIVKLIVLRALASNGGAMRPHEIADWTQTERHNITALINRMRQEGLVAAERDSSNKRYVNITLTGKGREALSLVMPAAREVVDQVMWSISEGDALQLEKLMKVLRQNAHGGFEHVAKQASPKPD